MPTIRRRLRLSFVLAAALILIGTQAVVAVDWSSASAISTSGAAGASMQSTAVTGTQTVHVAFTDQAGPGAVAMYRRSTDGGATWEDPVEISRPEAFGATALALESTGTTLDLVIGEFDASDNFFLYYRTSSNEGVDWSEPMRLTPLTGDAGKADVSRSGSRVTVAWTDGATGRVLVRVSTDGGATFGHRTEVGVTSNQPYSGFDSYDAWVAVADAGGTINVAWKRSDRILRTRRSTNAGESWRPVVTLSQTADNLYVTLMAAGDKVAIGYTSAIEGHWRATLRRSTNEGRTWRAPVLVGGRDSWFPIFELRGGLLRAAYSRCTEMTNTQCLTEAAFLRLSQNFGTDWSASSQASRPAHGPYAFAVGLGALSDDRSVVIYGRINETEQQSLFARRTL